MTGPSELPCNIKASLALLAFGSLLLYYAVLCAGLVQLAILLL